MERKAGGVKSVLSCKVLSGEDALWSSSWGRRDVCLWETTHCTGVGDQLLLSILVALDISLKPGSHFAYLMRVVGLENVAPKFLGQKGGIRAPFLDSR